MIDQFTPISRTPKYVMECTAFSVRGNATRSFDVHGDSYKDLRQAVGSIRALPDMDGWEVEYPKLPDE